MEMVGKSISTEARRARLKALQRILGNGVDTNEPDDSGLTPLMSASLSNRPKVIQFLLDHGAELLAKERSSGCDSLTFACLSGKADAVRALLKKGADVDAADRLGRTALMAAAALGNSKAVRLLLSHGANPNTESKLGTTAADLAAIEGHMKILQQLMPFPSRGKAPGRRAA
jgi:ankyrin repeat protein